MRKSILIICMLSMASLGLWFFFNHTRTGVGFRVLCQMIVSPAGLFDNKVECPIRSDTTSYDIIMTNRFVGCYAVRIKVPMKVHELEASPFSPPDILKVEYTWSDGSFQQAPCEKSWSSLNEGPRTFAYKSVLVPIDVPMNKEIRVTVEFPKESHKFFAEHQGCTLSFGKDSDD